MLLEKILEIDSSWYQDSEVVVLTSTMRAAGQPGLPHICRPGDRRVKAQLSSPPVLSLLPHFILRLGLSISEGLTQIFPLSLDSDGSVKTRDISIISSFN